MNNAIKNVLIFSLGAATGSLVAWRLLKTKYEQFAQDEIDSYKKCVREMSSEETVKSDEDKGTDEATEEVVEKKKESLIPEDLLNRYRSDNYTKEDRAVRAPYVISPEEYGTIDGYACISLTHYADGVLTDERDNVIQNVDDVVGDDFASHYGEYEDDSVFIRNEGEKRDYEILRDLNSFADTIGYPDSEE